MLQRVYFWFDCIFLESGAGVSVLLPVPTHDVPWPTRSPVLTNIVGIFFV